MWTPVWSKEDELVDLIVYAISQAVSDREEADDFGNTKIAKIAYDVADALDLDITRSWYMFGTYVWSDNATKARMEEFQTLDEDDPQIRRTIEQALGDERELYEQMVEIVSKHPMLEMTLSQFLDQLYEKAPSRYRGLYKSHKRILRRMRNIVSSLSSPDSEPQYINASREITAFQKEMMVFNDLPDMVDMVLDYTNLLEDLIVKYDSILENPDQLSAFIPFFKEMYDEYRNEIWTFPPSLIAVETVKGEREEEVKEDREKHLKKLPSYYERAQDRREDAYLKGFYPTDDEVQRYQKVLVKLVGADEEILKDYFAGTVRLVNRG